MIKSLKISLLLGVIFGITSVALAAPTTHSLDTDKSTIKWLGKKVIGKHNGTVKLKEGSLEVMNDEIKGGKFVIDFSTISNQDLEGTKDQAKLEGHLKSDDFFFIEKFPTGTFVVSSVKAGDKPDIYEVSGDLTVKGIKKGITFPATITKSGDQYIAKANLKIDRTLWDIRYNSGKFFDIKRLGEKMIYDDIEIELELYTS